MSDRIIRTYTRPGLYDWNNFVAVPAAAGASDSVETAQFLARVTTQDTSHHNAYAALIDGLVADSLWAKLDALYIFAAAEIATARTNLKSSSFGLTSTAEPTFAADVGYTGDGLTTYLNTQFTPSTGGSQYGLNSGSYGVYSRTNVAGNGDTQMGGNWDVASFLNIWQNTATTPIYSVNGNSISSATVVTDTSGMYVVSRTAASGAGAVSLYRYTTAGGAGTGLIDASTNAAAALNTTPIYIFAVDANNSPSGFCPYNMTAAFIGGGLNATEANNLSSRINTYMTTFSINV